MLISAGSLTEQLISFICPSTFYFPAPPPHSGHCFAPNCHFSSVISLFRVSLASSSNIFLAVSTELSIIQSMDLELQGGGGRSQSLAGPALPPPAQLGAAWLPSLPPALQREDHHRKQD